MTSDVLSAPQDERAYEGTDPTRDSLLRRSARWETGLVVVLIGIVIFGSTQGVSLLTGSSIFYIGINIGFIALMAMPMTFIIMTGEIDLSVASMLGLSGATMGFLWHHGWAIWPAMLGALLVGVIGGALNGVLISRLGLPSIAVTIGTLTLFRGLAQVLLGSLTVPGVGDQQFPAALTNIGTESIPGMSISYTTGIFIVLAIGCGVVLHYTPLGRSLYAIGLQPEAARFSGIRVSRISFGLYVFSGLISALAGILLTLQNASVSYSAGIGLELNVVAIVLFGGVSIFGGRGTVIGVVIAVAIFGSLQVILTQMQVQPEKQQVVTGLLLLISVVVPNGAEIYRRARARVVRTRQTA
ncbi:ABC transporter permease [Dermatophilaceae bacterium Sec6.4]